VVDRCTPLAACSNVAGRRMSPAITSGPLTPGPSGPAPGGGQGAHRFPLAASALITAVPSCRLPCDQNHRAKATNRPTSTRPPSPSADSSRCSTGRSPPGRCQPPGSRVERSFSERGSGVCPVILVQGNISSVLAKVPDQLGVGLGERLGCHSRWMVFMDDPGSRRPHQPLELLVHAPLRKVGRRPGA